MVSMDVAINPRSDIATTGAVLLDKDELAALANSNLQSPMVQQQLPAGAHLRP